MNKRQKQLINTYFRKREIAVNQNIGHISNRNYTPYEESYVVYRKLETMPIKNLSYREWSTLLTHNPQFIDEFLKHIDLDVLDINNKFKILTYQPQFEELLNVNYDAYDYNYGLNEDYLYNLLLKQPQFIDRVDERVVAKLEPYKRYKIILQNPELYDIITLRGISNSQHADLITKHPDLIHRFLEYFGESQLQKLGRYNIGNILLTHPDLYTLFDEKTIDELEDGVKLNIAKHSPEFTKKYIHKTRDPHYLKEIIIKYPHMYYLLSNMQRNFIRTYHHQLILKHPELIEKLEDISQYTIVEVLLQDKNLMDKFDYSVFKKPHEFAYLFREIPEAINNDTVNKYISPEMHLQILNDYPDVIKNLSFKYIIKKTFKVDGLVKFNPKAMNELLKRKPDIDDFIHRRNKQWWDKNKLNKDE